MAKGGWKGRKRQVKSLQDWQKYQGDSVPFTGEDIYLRASRAAGRASLLPPVTVAAPVFPLVCLCLRPFPVEIEDMGRRKDIFGNVSLQSAFFTRLPQLQNVKGKKILELTPDRP